MADDIVVFRKSRFSFLVSWFWPSSFERARESERQILEYGGIKIPAKYEYQEHDSEFKRNETAHLLHVDIGQNEYINTLKLDSNGFSATSEKKVNVVVCHGFGAGLGFFYKNFAALMGISSSRIFAIDWLGMGMSSRPVFAHSKPESAEQAVEFFIDSFERWREKQENLEEFVLIGHSLGGYLSTLYAIKYPEKVKKLILLSPVGIPERTGENISVTGHEFPKWFSSVWNSSYTPQWFIRSMGPMGPRFVKGYTTRRFPYLDPKEGQAFCDYLYHISAAPGSGEYALSSILSPGAWARLPLKPKFSSLKVPTTFICIFLLILDGEEDWMDFQNAEDSRPLIQAPTKVIRVSNAGHHLYLDNPEDTNSLLIKEIKETMQ